MTYEAHRLLITSEFCFHFLEDKNPKFSPFCDFIHTHTPSERMRVLTNCGGFGQKNHPVWRVHTRIFWSTVILICTMYSWVHLLGFEYLNIKANESNELSKQSQKVYTPFHKPQWIYLIFILKSSNRFKVRSTLPWLRPDQRVEDKILQDKWNEH